MRARIAMVLAGVLGLIMVQAAKADTITAKFDSYATNGDIYISAPGISGVSSAFYNAVKFRLERQYPASSPNNDHTGAPTPGSIFDTFCVEMSQGLDKNWRTYTLQDLATAPVPGGGMGTDKANFIKDLWALHIGATNTDVGAAALQIGLWEIIYDGTKKLDGSLLFDLSGGNISFSESHAWNPYYTQNSTVPGALAQAQSWLGGLNVITDSRLIGTTQIKAMVSGAAQDQVLAFTDQIPGVPLPASIWTGMALMGIVVAVRLRLKRHD